MLVPMKKAMLYALKEDRDSILLALQRGGNVMLIPSAEEKGLPGSENVGNEVEKTHGAIKFMDMHVGKSSFLASRTPVPYTKFLQNTPEAAGLAEQVATLEDKISSLRNESITMLAQAEAVCDCSISEEIREGYILSLPNCTISPFTF